MRALRTAFWGIVAICLVILGLANRGMVTLRLLPEGLSGLFGITPALTMPLYAVVLIGVALGLLIGFVWEWLREYRHRAAARKRAREVNRLEREVDRLRHEKHEGQDDVLALVDRPATPARS
ncbi:lipopolysaccharide assembly protein LapA domain-containing protein [Limimaricola sp.]|uniref:lipopolysaccharide assembly protein LapA domain-containing protein n=1 Tax=Limimaricola sp. TaxID=2211665 RepID=UPI0040592277